MHLVLRRHKKQFRFGACELYIFFLLIYLGTVYLQLFYKKTNSFIEHSSVRNINNKQKSHLYYKTPIKTNTGLQDINYTCVQYCFIGLTNV